MRTARALVCAGVTWITLAAAYASSPAQHSMAWYYAYTSERFSELRSCVARHAFLTDNDCGNADAALLDHLYIESRTAEDADDWSKSWAIVIANPATYRTSALAAVSELHACKTPFADARPRASWRAAAVEAKREDGQ
jgi:hypothetical protein